MALEMVMLLLQVWPHEQLMMETCANIFVILTLAQPRKVDVVLLEKEKRVIHEIFIP